MRHKLSGLRQAGAAVCVCLIVAGVMAGCAPNMPGNSAHASATATYPAPYAQSAKLGASLATLDQVGGPIVGTMKVGSNSRPLTGLVSIKGGATEIRMLVGDPTTFISDEIVVGGHRYTSPDDNVWIDRGAKPASSSLAKTLAAADTTVDSGIDTVTGISAHKIVTPADVVDVAPALGIDTWTFDQETTTLRIWADDAGKPIGFGASMGWTVTLGGQTQAVAIDFDVMFAAEAPLEILAPAKAWQWIQDKPAGIAFGVPSTWKPSDINSSMGVTSYVDPAKGYLVTYVQQSAGDKSLTDVTKSLVDSMADTPGGTQSIVVGSEDASLLSAHRTKQNDYEAVALVVHETVEFEVLVVGAPADVAGTDAIFSQILATVEFTR